MDCFRISNLSFSYPHESNFALKNINLTIRQGEFVVLCGKSGCGKTTLLNMLKPELTPKGALHGEIVLFGKIKEHFSLRESAEKIGYLVQNTEYGTVTHSVRAELAFGLENLGCHSKLIRLRMAEIATYFALDDMLDKETSVLSGGQKQLLCLAAVVAMHPRVILLDEPVSQLDPVAAAAFLDAAKKLCTENGITIVMAEHRLENAIALADRLVVMEQGEIIGDCHPRNLAENLLCGNVFVRAAAPVAMKLHTRLHCNGEMPLHVAEGQRMLLQMFGKEPQYTIPAVSPSTHSDKNAVRMKNVRFAYSAVGYVLKNLELTVKQGTFTALMGANGTGKTTALLLMCGILECKAGKIELLGKNIKKYKADELYNGTVALLPQKCESLFAGNCVREDLDFVLRNAGVKKEERQKRIAEVAEFAEISALLHKHPYDLSGGELQRAALAMVLLKRPKILFLDEPTKGMDALFKQKFAEKISQLCACGLTVVMVSHDAEFCAQYCDECALIFDGECILQSNRYDFFAQNYFYTTAANKLARDLFPTAVTYEQVLELCKKNLQN